MKTSHVKNDDVVYNYCCQYGHMKDDCYVKRNANECQLDIERYHLFLSDSKRNEYQNNFSCLSILWEFDPNKT